MLDYANILTLIIEEVEAARSKCAALLQDLPLSIATEAAEAIEGFEDMRDDISYIRDEKLIAQTLMQEEQIDTGYFDYMERIDNA